MLQLPTDPSTRQLRQFAAIWWPLFCVVVGAALLRLVGPPAAIAVWTLGVVLGLIGWWLPSVIRPVFLGLLVLTYPIGWLISHVVLVVLYFLVLTPIGLLLRLIGRDPLERSSSAEAESTSWRPWQPPSSKARYFRQY